MNIFLSIYLTFTRQGELTIFISRMHQLIFPTKKVTEVKLKHYFDYLSCMYTLHRLKKTPTL